MCQPSQALKPSVIATGFLRSHPPPQLRLPLPAPATVQALADGLAALAAALQQRPPA